MGTFRAVTSACGHRFPASFIVRLTSGSTSRITKTFPKGRNSSGTASATYRCVWAASFVIPNLSLGRLNAPALSSAFPGSKRMSPAFGMP